MSPRPDRTPSTRDDPTASPVGGGDRSAGADVTTRRGLLASVAVGSIGATAGCSSGGSCDDVGITSAHASVEYWCDYGPRVTRAQLRGYAEGCPGTPTVELVDDGEVEYEQEIDGDGSWSLPTGEDGIVPGDGDVLRVRDASGDVVAEETATLHHYYDEPELFVDVEPVSLEDEPVAVGERVELDVTVGNLGGASDYVVRLRVDGEAVARREGSADDRTDCVAATGSEYAFTHAFEEPGEHDVSVEIEPAGADGTGSERELGPVTVTEQ